MTPIRRWPFPSGCLLAVAVSIIIWLAIITLGEWAVGLALNIVGAR
mgnify:FL=1